MRCYPLKSLLLLLLLLVLGCGTDKCGPPIVGVSGRVTLDNRPLAKATVRFQPATREGDPRLSPDSYGETDEQGYYILKPGGDRSGAAGALVGPHWIQISVFDRAGDGRSGPRELVPYKYNRDSKLTFTVPPEGTTDADFNLASK